MITVDLPKNGLKYLEERDKFSLADSVKAEKLTSYESYKFTGLSNGNGIARCIYCNVIW